MSILTGKSIIAARRRGDIEITPFKKDQLNTGSYDVRLGRQVVVYSDWSDRVEHPGGVNQNIIDIKNPPKTKTFTMDKYGLVLYPRIFYLMHTEEVVYSKCYVPVLDGKSSIGRLGIKIHFTAGYGDVGFNGQYTLEVEVAGPIRVYPGIRIGQIRFHETSGEIEDYSDSGHYVGRSARGAVGSRAHLQIKEDGI